MCEQESKRRHLLHVSPSKCSESSSNNSEDEFSSNECESNKKTRRNRSSAGKNSTPAYNASNVASSRTTSAPIALHHAPHRAGDMAEDHGTKSTPFLKQSLNTIQFSRSSVGGSKYLVNAHANASSSDGGATELMFESRFESGNLAKAIKVTPVYYELYLRPDLYTNKHTQWFYFRVTNTRKNLTYRSVEWRQIVSPM